MQIATPSTVRAMQRRMFTLWSSFGERQLRTVVDFLERSTDLFVACTEEVSHGSPSTAKRRSPPVTPRRT